MKHKHHIKRLLHPAAAVLFTAFIITVALIRSHIYPFGENLLVYNDMQYQYTDFFLWFSNVLHGKDSLIYSFHSGLGGSTLALFAYYLASPLNLLVYFVDSAHIGEFLTLLICLKLLLCSVTSYIYISRRFQPAPLFRILISVSYALMGYNILQCSNIMWLDGVIAAPVIALGIYRLISGNRRNLYFFTLFYGILTCWYTGYMLCLFAVLYFLFEMFLHYEKKSPVFRQIFKTTGIFISTSILSLMASGILFIPQAIHMLEDGEGFDLSIFKPAFGFSYLEGFRDFFLEPDVLTWNEYIPPVYIGSFVLFLTVLFLVAKGPSTFRKKLAAAYFFGFILIFAFRPLNYIFTVFRIPTSHTYRYAFIYGLFMIAIAGMCADEIRYIRQKYLIFAALIIAGTGMIFDMIRPYGNQNRLYFSCFAALITGIGLIIIKKKPRRIAALLSVCLLLLCTTYEFSSKMQMIFSDHTENVQWYRSYTATMKEELADLMDSDQSLYRVDKNFSRTPMRGANESLALGYSSVSNYTSTNNVKEAVFLRKMGYTNDTTLVPYTANLVMDSLLGVKYIYSREPITGCEQIRQDILDGIRLYRNPYALPLGYAVNNLETAEDYGTNVFENQTLLCKHLSGQGDGLYTSAEIQSQDTDGNSWTSWELKVPADGAFYCYFSNEANNTNIEVNGQYFKTNPWYENPILYLGEYKSGDTVTIRLLNDEGNYKDDYGLCAATLNTQVLKNVTDLLRSRSCTIQKMEKGEVLAEYDAADEETLLLTVPDENGWDLYINGKKSTKYQAENTFIAVPVSKGHNTIQLRYHAPGLRAGIFSSVLALGLFSFLSLSRNKKKH